VKIFVSSTYVEKLKNYGIYKQATIGDCNTDHLGFFEIKVKAKWDAWSARKGNLFYKKNLRMMLSKIKSIWPSRWLRSMDSIPLRFNDSDL